MPGPHAKFIKTMDSSKMNKEEADRLSKRLPWDDLLPQILSFVGESHYRFVGSINHSFRDAYLAIFPSKETYVNISSKALAELFMKDCAEKWDFFEYLEEERDFKMDGSFIATCMLQNAALSNNFEVLQHLHSLPFDSAFKEVIWSCTYISASAAIAGHLHIVQWLHEQDLSCGNETCTWAARRGQLEVLQWCHTHDFEWDVSTFGAAVEGGHWPVLNYLYDNGCPWDSWTCAIAAGSDLLDVLQWFRSKGCPWCPRTPWSAAFFGHLHILQWAYYNNCPVDYETCKSAFYRKHWEIFDWALDNSLPLDREFFPWFFEDEDMDDDEEEESETDDDEEEGESETDDFSDDGSYV